MKNTVKKLLCTALAFIMAFAAVPAFAVSSVVTHKGNLTDCVTLTEVTDLQNVKIVDILDCKEQNSLIVKNEDNKYFYYSSNNGVDFVSTDLSSQLASVLGIDITEIIDYEFTNVNEINEQIIIYGWYSIIGQREYLEYDGTPASYETEISKNFAWKTSDGVTFTNMNMPNLNTLCCGSYITECNGKYVYLPETQLAFEVSRNEDGSSCAGFYYVSDNLTDWKLCKTPEFSVRWYHTEEHITKVEYKTSKNTLAAIASESSPAAGEGTIFHLICCTSDFENYTETDTEFIEEGFVEEFLDTDRNILVIFVGIVYWENDEYYGILKDAIVYTLDMTNGKVEKVLSEHNNKSIGGHTITKDNYERTMFFTDNNDGSVHYSNDGYKTITTVNLGSGDKDYLNINTDYTWSYGDYTIGTCENIENKLCVIKDDFSEVYALDFENIETTFISGGMFYIIANGKYYAISIEELLNSLDSKSDDETAVLQSIRIISVPEKTSYTYMSESNLDLSGLTIEAIYSNGSKEIITDTSLFNISELDTSILGTQKIVVEYNGCSDVFEVEITNSFWQIIISYIFKIISILFSFVY